MRKKTLISLLIGQMALSPSVFAGTDYKTDDKKDQGAFTSLNRMKNGESAPAQGRGAFAPAERGMQGIPGLEKVLKENREAAEAAQSGIQETLEKARVQGERETEPKNDRTEANSPETGSAGGLIVAKDVIEKHQAAMDKAHDALEKSGTPADKEKIQAEADAFHREMNAVQEAFKAELENTWDEQKMDKWPAEPTRPAFIADLEKEKETSMGPSAEVPDLVEKYKADREKIRADLKTALATLSPGAKKERLELATKFQENMTRTQRAFKSDLEKTRPDREGRQEAARAVIEKFKADREKLKAELQAALDKTDPRNKKSLQAATEKHARDARKLNEELKMALEKTQEGTSREEKAGNAVKELAANFKTEREKLKTDLINALNQLPRTDKEAMKALAQKYMEELLNRRDEFVAALRTLSDRSRP